MKKFSVFLCSVALVVGLTATAFATPINLVSNPSFEAAMTAPIMTLAGGGSYNYAIPSWNLDFSPYGYSGTFLNSSAQFGPNSGLDGNQFAYIQTGGGFIYQEIASVSFDLGATYDFSFSVGLRGENTVVSSFPQAFALVRAINTSDYNIYEDLYFLDDFGSFDPGEFKTFGGTTLPTPLALTDGTTNYSLFVYLVQGWDSQSGPQIAYDNVRLSAAPVPEPATMLLLGSGLIGLAAVSRRKFFKK